jgi:large subunit ribosomal protein L15
MPIHRRLPKRGFKNPFRRQIAIVNLEDLARLESGAVVDPPALARLGLLKGVFDAVKLLGRGEVQRPLTIRLDLVSRSARQKIEAAGGTVEGL